MSDELILPIDKSYWPKGVMRGLTPLLRELGDKNGNLVIAAVPNKHIMVKGASDNIAKAKPGLLKLFEEHFPDAPVPAELSGKAAASPKTSPAAAPAKSPKTSPKAEPARSPKQEPKKAPASPKETPKATPKAVPVVVKDLKLVKAGKPDPKAMYSPELLWQCVKTNSSMLRKSPTPNMPWMSACPNNLTGVNSFKFSGLTGGRTLGLNSVKDGDKETIILSTANKKRCAKARPGSMTVKTGIPKNAKKGLAALDKAIAGKLYRTDLLELVKTKYNKIKTSFKKKALTVKSRRSAKK